MRYLEFKTFKRPYVLGGEACTMNAAEVRTACARKPHNCQHYSKDRCIQPKFNDLKERISEYTGTVLYSLIYLFICFLKRKEKHGYLESVIYSHLFQ